MKRTLLIVAGLLMAGPALAQPIPVQNGGYMGVVGSAPYVSNELAYCQLSISSTATALSSCSGGVPALARTAFIKAETQGIRCRGDGTNPTASVGFPIGTSDAAFAYSAAPLSALKCIAQTATSTVDVWFYQ